ncbi:hypothetical protein [Nonomuraea rubra]|uniref:hypothetical protein n=1 Tax=Nonomuraea rubra TaxID=46180 RepID=UPI003CD08642
MPRRRPPRRPSRRQRERRQPGRQGRHRGLPRRGGAQRGQAGAGPRRALRRARRRAAQRVRLRRHGRRFHRDGSFIQHAVVAYTGSYGLSLLIAVAETVGAAARLTLGDHRPGDGGWCWTPWNVPSHRSSTTGCSWTPSGAGPPAGRRSPTAWRARRDRGGAAAGAQRARAVPEPVQVAGQGWIERGRALPYLEHASVAETRRAVEVLDDKTIEAATGPTGTSCSPP